MPKEKDGKWAKCPHCGRMLAENEDYCYFCEFETTFFFYKEKESNEGVPSNEGMLNACRSPHAGP